ncbi:hypothetical protein EBZ39_00430 [bacterium]|nr:hypothetical protein [bacterium]
MEKWVQALRSKKYKQGHSVLKQKTRAGVTRHCCLGVLCELYQQDRRKRGQKVMPSFVKKQWNTSSGNKNKVTFYLPDTECQPTHLPKIVQRWAGVQTDSGHFPVSSKPCRAVIVTGNEHADADSLMALNDEGATFTQIAEIIEEHYKDL